jgi:hypothetical protein
MTLIQLAVAGSALLAAAAPPDPAELREAMRQQLKAARTGAIAVEQANIIRIDREIEQARESQKKVPRNRARKQKLAEIRDTIDHLRVARSDAEEKIAELKAGRGQVFLPKLDLTTPGLGDLGSLEPDPAIDRAGAIFNWTVADVISDTEFVAYPNISTFELEPGKFSGTFKRLRGEKRGDVPYLFRGVDTSRMIDGKRTPISGTFYIRERVHWRFRKVFVLESISVPPEEPEAAAPADEPAAKPAPKKSPARGDDAVRSR